jgi:hypothetical protein
VQHLAAGHLDHALHQGDPPAAAYRADPQGQRRDRYRAEDVDGDPGQPLAGDRLVPLERPGQQRGRRAGVLGVRTPGAGGGRSGDEHIVACRLVERVICHGWQHNPGGPYAALAGLPERA